MKYNIGFVIFFLLNIGDGEIPSDMMCIKNELWRPHIMSIEVFSDVVQGYTIKLKALIVTKTYRWLRTYVQNFTELHIKVKCSGISSFWGGGVQM